MVLALAGDSTTIRCLDIGYSITTIAVNAVILKKNDAA